MSLFTERWEEMQRREAAVAIAYHCRGLEWEHPISQMIREGENDEALWELDFLDLWETLSGQAGRELKSAPKEALQALDIELRDEWEFDTTTVYFSVDTLQEIWDLDEKMTATLVGWLYNQIGGSR